MSYRVQELALAQADISNIFAWLSQRSAKGAEAWLDAYDAVVQGLERFVGHGVAPESKPDFKVQQVFIKTRHGNVYRALYYVQDEDVYILRVRGKGQVQVRPPELGRLELPEE